MSYITPDCVLINRYPKTVKWSLLKLKEIFFTDIVLKTGRYFWKFPELSSRSKALDESDCPSPKFNVSL